MATKVAREHKIVLVQTFSSALTAAVAWATLRFGIHLNAGSSAEVTALIALASGYLSALVARSVVKVEHRLP